MNQIGVNAINASRNLLNLDTNIKNLVLNKLADKLIEDSKLIIEANNLDLIWGSKLGLSDAFLDRLMLNEERIIGMANSLREIANFSDPIGEIITGWKHGNGMLIEQKRVPIGVIGVIYESRPNVTIDAAGLAIKTSNSIILRGSEQALNSNKCLMQIINQIGNEYGLPKNSVQLIEFEEVDYIKELIQRNDVVDVVIPRGGPGLKSFVKEHASVPIIFAGAGICHAYVDRTANIDDAINIIINSKTQRPSTCNSIESVLINREIANEILDKLTSRLLELNVELRYCSDAFELVKNKQVLLATDDDFGVEFSDLILSLKIIDSIEEAIQFINGHSSKHSDSIITNDLNNAEKFLNEVDSACVYLNSSTRFSDGNEFGFGGEIGISTQKLHARGPMGIRELTTTKYIIRGSGQIR